MSESAAEKTELPTPKRLREARQKGQVAHSKEIVSALLLVCLCFLCGGLLIRLSRDFSDLIDLCGAQVTCDFTAAFECVTFKSLRVFAFHTLLFCGTAILIAVTANLAQIGFLFTFEPLKPSLERISPTAGCKRIFSLRNLFEFGKNILKTLFLGYLVYTLIRHALPELPPLCYGTIDDLFPLLSTLFKRLTLYTFFGCALIAAADFFFQRRNHIKQLMMTKAEVRREYKETEVSQEVRRARNELARELANHPQLREGVRRSSVIVTNPTHIAVGLRYVKDETPLPQIAVMGADHVAALIRHLAAEEGVPLMENVPLARALYAQTTIDDYIPEPLIAPVVEVLKWLESCAAAKKEAEALDAITL